MPVRLTFVRHGETEFNAEDRLRGWMDPPLNKAGFAAAERLGKLFHISSRPILSSDLVRATQTAYRLRGWQLPPITTHRELRPWNVGVYAGQPGSVVHQLLVEYAMQRPDVPVPFGESFTAFTSRFLGFLRSLQQDAVVVTHYRNCAVVKALKLDGTVDFDRLFGAGVQVCTTFEVEFPSRET